MRSTLDELLERVNILDVISQYVKLRKAGKNYSGLCPFHKEKTPSFSVSTEKQMYYCFGCKEGGNAVNFLMKYENFTFQEALESLARKYGVEIEKKGSARRASVYDGLSKLAAYYQSNLKNSRVAMNYLTDRGIDEGMIREFGMGYSDRSRPKLKAFMKDAGVPSDILLSTGLLRVRDGETYDILGGRVVIPIVDASRKVIGFGGRSLDKEGFPKYINSPESAAFSKRQALFGIDKTRKEIVETNEAIIVEGYFDLIALYGAGIRNVVSTLGTSVTEDQLVRLRNLSENVTLMLDGDEAGVKASLKLIALFSELDLNGSMVILPKGHDPDSFVRREGADAVKELLQRKKPILDYFFEYHMNQAGVESLEGKMSFIRKVMPHIEAVRDTIRKNLYVRRLSELTNIDESHFRGAFKEQAAAPKNGQPAQSMIGRRVIGAVVSNPGLLSLLREREVMEHIKDVDVKEVLSRMCDYYEGKRCLDVHGFVSVLESAELKDFVLASVFEEGESDEGTHEQVVGDYIRHVKKGLVIEEARRITDCLLDAERRGDERAISELLDKKRDLLANMKSSL